MAHYTRKANILTNTETGEVTHYEYINQAKRASRKLQKEGNSVSKVQGKFVPKPAQEKAA